MPAAIIIPKFIGVTGVLWSGPVADSLAFILALAMVIYEIKKLINSNTLSD